MLLAIISKVMQAIVRLNCRLLFAATGSSTAWSWGTTSDSAAMAVKCTLTMPAAMTRLAKYLSS
ncbi:hypothetical protein D3C78_1898530 [compost metagenome]